MHVSVDADCRGDDAPDEAEMMMMKQETDTFEEDNDVFIIYSIVMTTLY